MATSCLQALSLFQDGGNICRVVPDNEYTSKFMHYVDIKRTFINNKALIYLQTIKILGVCYTKCILLFQLLYRGMRINNKIE